MEGWGGLLIFNQASAEVLRHFGGDHHQPEDLMASTGGSLAARLAGATPASKPEATATPKAKKHTLWSDMQLKTDVNGIDDPDQQLDGDKGKNGPENT